LDERRRFGAFWRGLPMNILVNRRFELTIISGKKIHTLRKNYLFWKRRIANAGELSIRYWEDKPRHSKQITIRNIRLYMKNSNFGVQEVCKINDGKSPGSLFSFYLVEDQEPKIRLDISVLAENDGLTLQQFIDWFKDYPEGAMALIHFTSFRY
jgi:hypothetical protein